MLATFTAWMNATRGELTEVGVEVAVEGSSNHVRRERLRSSFVAGSTGSSATPKAVRWLSTSRLRETLSATRPRNLTRSWRRTRSQRPKVRLPGEPATQPGGARLVFVAKSNKKDGAAQRVQPPLTAEAVEMWRDVIHNAAAATQGPQYLARVNDGCRHCPVRSSCPAHDEGRQVSN